MKKVLFIILISVVSLGGMVGYQQYKFSDGKLHIIFCDVGQGDAIVIRTPTSKTILVDGGPDRSVLSCLSEHLPFWERTIDLMLLTHPHVDHFIGMSYVIDRYITKSFATENLSNDTHSFADLQTTLDSHTIPQQMVSAGDEWKIGEVTIRVEAPTKDYLSLTSPGGEIGESGEFASLVLRISYGDFSVLLTGDSQAEGMDDALRMHDAPVTVLQSPHHGSATGLTDALVDSLQPQLAVVSVGEKNRYGHPTKKTLSIFERYNIPVKRTDQDGSIEIVSDGDVWKAISVQ